MHEVAYLSAIVSLVACKGFAHDAFVGVDSGDYGGSGVDCVGTAVEGFFSGTLI